MNLVHSRDGPRGIAPDTFSQDGLRLLGRPHAARLRSARSILLRRSNREPQAGREPLAPLGFGRLAADPRARAPARLAALLEVSGGSSADGGRRPAARLLS